MHHTIRFITAMTPLLHTEVYLLLLLYDTEAKAHKEEKGLFQLIDLVTQSITVGCFKAAGT